MTSDDSYNPGSATVGALAVGEQVGAWRVVRFVGRGGMGSVYLCERVAGGFTQQAALKLVDVNRPGSQVVARFLAERQILASLEHPNVAQLLDAGSTPAGVPYLVMEYVDGAPIDRYCDDKRLSTRARLRLFCAVCRAVHAAHARLIVHRDIKPENILVSDQGVPKLLDFGIAKLLEPGVTSEAPKTRADMRLLTPEYASPEQVRGESVTTASDVYSLGVVLYRLLCGHAPYDVAHSSELKLEQVVCEEQPTGPSTRPGHTRDDVAICAVRQTTPARLRQRLRGDLDNIVLMALRKEPQRRYPSALRLAEDIEHYLADRPVTARPATLGYRLAKFIRRNTIAVTTGAVTAVLIVALVGYYTVRVAAERDRAAEAARKATHTAAFLRDLFQVAGPADAQDPDITARELLDRGARRLDIMLAEQPDVRATLQDTMGGVYLRLGLYDNARTLLERAVATRRALAPDEPAAIVASLLPLAEAQIEAGEFEPAQELLEEALALCARGGESLALLRASALRVRGFLHEALADYAASVADLSAALGAFESLEARDNPEYARALTSLALVHDHLGEYEQSLALLERAFARQRSALGPLHPLTTDAQNALAVAQDRLHRYAQAEQNYLQALDNAIRLYGPLHPVVGDIQGNLGRLYNHMGRQADSRRYYEKTLATTRGVYGERHHYVGYDLIALAKSSALAGDPAQAEEYFRQALAIYADTLPEAHPYVAAGLISYARMLIEQDRPAQALALARRARTASAEALSEEHWLTAQTDVLIGVIYAKTREGDPLPLFRTGFERLLKMSGREHRITQFALDNLLAELERLGDVAAYAQYASYRVVPDS